MHMRSNNEETMNGSDTDEIIEGLFESFLQKYEENLQEKMKGSDFEFDGVDFLYYDFNKISINRGGSYIDSPKWIKNKKSTINPKNNDKLRKIENKNIEITYKIKFINSCKFMSSSLSKLVDNISEGLQNNQCLNCESCLDYIKTKNEKLILKCFNCKQYYEKDFNKELIKRFANTYEFCNKSLNKFILFLRKGVYPYEYMDNWERFDETSLPNKESFYSSLNIENIDDIDYRHGNDMFKTFKLKNLGEYDDLYVQSDTLLLADVFENFRNTCLKVYELDPAHFLSLPGLAWQACLKKTNIKLELLTDYDMLLMVEDGIRGGICHSIQRHAKANNKYMKNYDKNEESLYIQYLDASNLYGWEMSQKLPVNGFKWIEDTSEINEEFVKNYDENSDKGYILEVDVKYPRKLHDIRSDLPFLPKRMKIDKCKKLMCNLLNKKNRLCI